MGDKLWGDEGTVKLGFEWSEGLVNMGGGLTEKQLSGGT